MTTLVFRRAAMVGGAIVLAAPALASAQTVSASPDAGYMVYPAASPPLVLQPGPGTWLGASRQVVAPGLGGLAKGIPAVRLRPGGEAVVRLPWDARAIGVTILRPVRAKPRGGGLVLSRTPLEARLVNGDSVHFRMAGEAGIVLVYAVDAAGRGTASGRLIARTAADRSCRTWTQQLRKEKRPNGARATALRGLLLDRCVSPFGVPGAPTI
ncbi:MAG: hypothetical protein AB7V62_08485 [Thermoleophilia bacterium]